MTRFATFLICALTAVSDLAAAPQLTVDAAHPSGKSARGSTD